MSELSPITTKNVFEIDVATCVDSPESRKAVLAMQATGLYVAGDSRFHDANAQLHEIAQIVGMPPTMTYRDLVFNPNVAAGEDIPVLSSDPDIASDEAHFYVAHRRMETELYGAIDDLIGSDDSPTIPDKKLASAATILAGLHKGMTAKKFKAFRPFFVGINGYPGPSGLYAESFPILDFLIHGGRNVAPQERQQMRANIEEGLYPNHLNRSQLLESLLEESNPQLDMPDSARGRLIKQLNGIRRIHKGSVKKLIPEALDGTAEGSGGVADVASYLVSKVIRKDEKVKNGVITKLGIGLPGISIGDVRGSAEAAAPYDFDSFSVYGDLGDLPPYAALHAVADTLQGSSVRHTGPMGVPAGMMHPELIAVHAAALEEQLPEQTSVGLVRGAFLESIGEKPASLDKLEASARTVQERLAERELSIPLYIGGFGPKILNLAGRLGAQGVKLGGSTNVAFAEQARQDIANPDTDIVLGAVSVIDPDRKAARQLARSEVAKYLAVVGRLDRTLDGEDAESLGTFIGRFNRNDPEAAKAISDSLLDKFALAGTPEDALAAIEQMRGVVDRFEFGTPHGLGDRPTAIKYIAETILGQL